MSDNICNIHFCVTKVNVILTHKNVCYFDYTTQFQDKEKQKIKYESLIYSHLGHIMLSALIPDSQSAHLKTLRQAINDNRQS